ncbi:DUF6799 domain-containing protein [Hymenobacter negativus]|uniref:DUF6799 domain-containing protein n=1 Tax=Hymenobacter negativus TaxID=2795026 RepID=A0ABS0QD63_9BACT|nr:MULTISPECIES: DUF6799 domain-containing protein [Bacteria]MBH8560515.1 hypothetical protein [Hymenobacter negativus]MBH8569811.1 hypothetical protein [Hymenobacter negativus]MBR7209550.1 hypothetical protein [Microvirga sp. STS02]
MNRFFLLVFAAGCLATTPRLASAQAGGFPVQTTSRTQFVMTNGEVVRREGTQTTPLTQNVKLPSGVKINYKSGIVEMPADKVSPQGKKITLHEGDYVKPDGGVVFATPASAAAARGEGTPPTTPPGTKFEPYVQHGPGFSDPAMQISLLNKKIELLNQKIQVLSQGQSTTPNTKAIDDQLTQLDAQLNGPK